MLQKDILDRVNQLMEGQTAIIRALDTIAQTLIAMSGKPQAAEEDWEAKHEEETENEVNSMREELTEKDELRNRYGI